jgi:glycosyltransferase involved in cell wall biosynthesis
VRLTVLVDQFPALSETFVLNEVLALRRIGHEVHVESAAWAPQRAEVPLELDVTCLDDDGEARRLLDLAWLLTRHPVGCTRDAVSRLRWRREERPRPLRVIAPVLRRIVRRGDEHLHAHFAAGVALDALRAGRILGLPYSVTAHAYEIYRRQRNLREKLVEARLATGECEYSVNDLRRIAGPDAARRVHVVPMGVDHERFRRRGPIPGGRTVLAVGRLVEKKGTRHLLDAMALLLERDAADRLVILGDGPLRADLEAQAERLGISHAVDFLAARTATGVRDALEAADVLAFPAVLVSDGDRDVLPLVLGEALSMELPIVASDFVGIPEVVRPPWGRLVPPGDAGALASALEDVLALSVDERAAAGAAGRAFAVATRDLEDAAHRLTALLADPENPPPLPAAPDAGQITQVR